MVGDLADRARLDELLAQRRFAAVVHCAAHIWVGESVREPAQYYRQQHRQRDRPVRPVRHGTASAAWSSLRPPPSMASPSVALIDESQPLGADQPLRRLQDDERARAGRHGAAARPALRHPALLQRRRRRRRCADRRGDAGQRATWSRSPARPRCGLRPGMAINGTDYPTPDGTCIRDYVHVDDLARAHLLALAASGRTAARRWWPIAATATASRVREVLDTVRRVTGVEFPIEEGPRRPGRSGGAGRRQPAHPGAAGLGAAPRRSRLYRRHRLALGAAAAGELRGWSRAPDRAGRRDCRQPRNCRKSAARCTHASAGQGGAQAVRSLPRSCWRLSGLRALLAGPVAAQDAGPRRPRRPRRAAGTAAAPSPGSRHDGPAAPAPRHAAPRPPRGDLQALISTLEDEPARAELIARLRALTAHSRVCRRDRLSRPRAGLGRRRGRRAGRPARPGAGRRDRTRPSSCRSCRLVWRQLTEPDQPAMLVLDRPADRRRRAARASSPACWCGHAAGLARSPGPAAARGQTQGADQGVRWPIWPSTSPP